MTSSFDPNQKRGQPKNKAQWVAHENGDPESSLGDVLTVTRPAPTVPADRLQISSAHKLRARRYAAGHPKSDPTFWRDVDEAELVTLSSSPDLSDEAVEQGWKAAGTKLPTRRDLETKPLNELREGLERERSRKFGRYAATPGSLATLDTYNAARDAHLTTVIDGFARLEALRELDKAPTPVEPATTTAARLPVTPDHWHLAAMNNTMPGRGSAEFWRNVDEGVAATTPDSEPDLTDEATRMGWERAAKTLPARDDFVTHSTKGVRVGLEAQLAALEEMGSKPASHAEAQRFIDNFHGAIRDRLHPVIDKLKALESLHIEDARNPAPDWDDNHIVAYVESRD